MLAGFSFATSASGTTGLTQIKQLMVVIGAKDLGLLAPVLQRQRLLVCQLSWAQLLVKRPGLQGLEPLLLARDSGLQGLEPLLLALVACFAFNFLMFFPVLTWDLLKDLAQALEELHFSVLHDAFYFA